MTPWVLPIPGCGRVVITSHQLGHWHHDRGRVLFCQAEDIGRGAPGSLSPERLADRFASNLL
ncbi:MAG: hypothetical protein WAV02_09260, partial [Stellaceae bacterium]